MNVRPPRCALFLRVSTAKPEQEHGLVAQRRACEDYLERRGWSSKDGRIFEEQASGRRTKRPVLRAMLHEAAMHGFQVLVVFRLDRLSRGGIAEMFRILRALTAYGVRVFSVCETWWDPDNPTHELILAVLAWAAEFESKAIGERVAAGIAARRAGAERKGRPFLWGRARTSWVARDATLPTRVAEMRKRRLSWAQIGKNLGVSKTSARRLHGLGKSHDAKGRGSGVLGPMRRHVEGRARGRKERAQRGAREARR